MEHRHYTSSRGRQADPKERLQQRLLLRQQSHRIEQRARLDQLKIDQLEQRLISVEDMDAILVDIAGAVSSHLRSFPSRLMERLLPHVKSESKDEIFSLLTEMFASLTMELKTMESGVPVDPDADPFDELLEADDPER